MKKYLILFVCFLSSLIASAVGGKCGENLTWTYDKGVLTISGTGDMTNYTNSSSVPWKNFRKALTSAIINEGVTSIGESAFYGCSALTSVTIGNSVTNIGRSAFEYCTGLTSITIPNFVTNIGSSAFSGCTGLTSVNISDLANWCQISFENYLANPLYNAHKLVLNGSEVKDLVIPDGVTSIGDFAFAACSSLTSVVIPNSVASIGDFAFAACSSLASVVISNSVTSIGDYAFEYCSVLSSINIGNSVTSIGGNAFLGCYVAKDKFVNNSSCKDDKNWGLSICDSETEEGLLIKDNMAIKCRSWSTSVTIPNSVTSIGDYAFRDCSGLTSVTIGNSVTNIGEGTFYGCRGLTTVTIPNSVRSIGKGAFYECRGLTSVTIPNSVTSLGDLAFYYCESLTSVTIPSSVTNIGEGTFSGCRGLTTVTIPNSVTSIGEDAFYGCSSINEIYSHAIMPPTLSSDFVESVYKSANLYVPNTGDARTKYSAADYWKNFNNIIEIDMTGIEAPAINPFSAERNYYNLQGQRATEATRGINVVNGHKVLVR